MPKIADEFEVALIAYIQEGLKAGMQITDYNIDEVVNRVFVEIQDGQDPPVQFSMPWRKVRRIVKKILWNERAKRNNARGFNEGLDNGP